MDEPNPHIPRTSRTPALATGLLVLAAALVAGYFGWQHFKPKPAPVPVVEPVAEVPRSSPVPLPSSAPAIQHPIDPPAAEAAGGPAPLPALAEADQRVGELLSELLTLKNVRGFLQLDGFVRRSVATVDNLARQQAPASVWPVQSTPQRFTVQRGGGGVDTIHPDNARRYTPLVQMVDAVDTAQAVALYRRLYPLFQQAYEELGFPGSKEWLDFFSRAARNRLFGGSRKARCAVLVDGDNVPPRLTGALVHYASSLGRVTSIEV